MIGVEVSTVPGAQLPWFVRNKDVLDRHGEALPQIRVLHDTKTRRRANRISAAALRMCSVFDTVAVAGGAPARRRASVFCNVVLNEEDAAFV